MRAGLRLLHLGEAPGTYALYVISEQQQWMSAMAFSKRTLSVTARSLALSNSNGDSGGSWIKLPRRRFNHFGKAGGVTKQACDQPLPEEVPATASEAANTTDKATLIEGDAKLSDSSTHPSAPGDTKSEVDSPGAASPAEAEVPPAAPATEPSRKTAQRLFASWQQGIVASIGAVMGIGFLIYLFFTPVKEDTVHHTVVVASEALGDVRLKNQAIELSKEVVNNIINDPKSLILVSDLIVKLLASEDIKIAISSLLQSLFEDHYTQEVTKKFVLVIVRDPWIQDQIQSISKEQVLELLQDATIRQALSEFLIDAASDSLRTPELHFEAARAVRKSIAKVLNPLWN